MREKKMIILGSWRLKRRVHFFDVDQGDDTILYSTVDLFWSIVDLFCTSNDVNSRVGENWLAQFPNLQGEGGVLKRFLELDYMGS